MKKNFQTTEITEAARDQSGPLFRTICVVIQLFDVAVKLKEVGMECNNQ